MNIRKFTYHLSIDNDFPINGFSGRVIHGAVLQYLREADDQLSVDLHNGKERKPFSCTQLSFDKRIKGERPATFSITTYDGEICSVLIKSMMKKENKIFLHDQFYPIFKVDVENIQTNPEISYKEDTLIKICFKTPVIFSSANRKAKTDPFPHLNVLWRQMIVAYRRINPSFSEVDEKILVQKLVNQLATPYFKLRSTHIKLGHKIKVTGFTGSIYFLIEDDSNLELLPEILIIAENWGIGSKTTMGFGRFTQIIVQPQEKQISTVSKSNKNVENKR